VKEELPEAQRFKQKLGVSLVPLDFTKLKNFFKT
jgi:hypothetical protein